MRPGREGWPGSKVQSRTPGQGCSRCWAEDPGNHRSRAASAWFWVPFSTARENSSRSRGKSLPEAARHLPDWSSWESRGWQSLHSNGMERAVGQSATAVLSRTPCRTGAAAVCVHSEQGTAGPPKAPAVSLSLCPTLPTGTAPHHPAQTRLLPFAAAAPSFADMGNAIGSLIMLRKGQGQEEEEEDSVLLSEEHSLILTCCWVSVKVGTPPHGTGERHSPAQHSTHHPAHPSSWVLQLPLGHSPSLGTNKGESLPLPQSCHIHPHPLPGRMQPPPSPKADTFLPALM